MSDDSLVTHLLDRLAPLGDVSSRRMFGAQCLFISGSAFALVDGGVLYLKVDDSTRPAFEAAGGRPFTYFHKSKGVDVAMGYMTIPDDDIDGPALLAWGRKAALVAHSAKKPKKQPKKKAAQKAT